MAKKTATSKKKSASKVLNKVVKKATASSKTKSMPMKAEKTKPKSSEKKASPVKVTSAKKEAVIVPANKVPTKKIAVKESQIEKTTSSAKKEKEAIARPAMMTKKGRVKDVVASKSPQEDEERPAARKTQTVVSMLESDSESENAESVKVEKTSKVKPIKVERGNSADEKTKWDELFKKYGKEKATVYKMSEKFNSLTPLQHKVLGWGFILTNENDRLEVLFETGIRNLISNYKS